MSQRYYRAEVIYGKTEDVNCNVETVNFHGISRTKLDGLKNEISGIYSSKTLDELIKNANLAARHMTEVGLFTNCIAFVEDSPKSPNSYEVNFVTKEHKTFTLGCKMGVTTVGDADASLTASKDSLTGRGESISASYSKTIKGGNSFNFSATKPFLGWQKYMKIGSSLYRTFEDLQWNKSDLTENALIFNYSNKISGRPIFNHAQLNMAWRHFMPQPDAPFPVREHAGHTTKFSLENSIYMDTRDRPMLASKGIYCKIMQEYAGVMGDSAFLKHQFDLQLAAPLIFDTILSASLSAAIVRPLADRSLHLLDRLYLGGPHDVRGFNMRSIGTHAENSCIGGATSCAGAVHLFKPLYPTDMVYAHLFASAGSVSSIRSKNKFKDLIESPRVSVGLGIAINFKDIIRLELNYVMPLRFASGDACAPGLQFGAGLNFL